MRNIRWYFLLSIVALLVIIIGCTKDVSESQRSTTSTVVDDAEGLPVIKSFTVNPAHIQPGQTVVLIWDVSNADQITLTPAIGDVQATGSVSVIPAQSVETYQLIATNDNGSTKSEVQVYADLPTAPPPLMKKYRENDTSVIVSVGEQFEIDLETNPSTGKSWTFIVFGSSMLELVNVGYEAFPGPPAPGRPLIAKYVYKALKTGTTQLKMTYTGGETSIYDKTLTFNITVK